MSSVPTETVLKRWYNWEKKTWIKTDAKVKIQAKKFAEGSQRDAHYMVEVLPNGLEVQCVAKRQKEGDLYRSALYETDLITQAACKAIADAFNQRKPTKPVKFIDASMIKRADGTWWAVESYLKGSFEKHNNNWGYVAKEHRNTPQAFSHFSYEFTEGRMMIVDVQGVDDVYTDPQIHTADTVGFGLGNMGKEGFEKFFKSHRCNPVCASLGLPYLAPKVLGVQWHRKPKQKGTLMRANSLGADRMKVGQFISNLEPKPGSAQPEDLALLGLKSYQFDRLAKEFVELDADGSKFLDRDELCAIFTKMSDPSRGMDDKQYLEFVRRVEGLLNEDGLIDFNSYLLCWTNNL